ncbi:Actin cross-linking [Nannochloropsis gaditana]|uniref:Actin cross-linking n=1 Tax=Nannochloropsis gaditana TaxID=72520 RepID=W7TIV8_9STRA|nr:Actin cross-linking [Nannochloropsis gaditana]
MNRTDLRISSTMVAHNQSAGHVTFRPFSKPENPEAPYLTVQSDKPVALPAYSEHSLWTVEHLPNDEVALKGYNGHYLSVNSHFQVHMAKELSKESHLQFVTHADFPGCVAIKETVHHTFLA